jgi:4-carboxymuconolactone decarboxylase
MKPVAYPYPDLDKLPPELKNEVIGNRRSLNVYRMVMHSPAIAPSFLEFSDALRHHNSLPAQWRELAILRVGHCYAAPYEIHHHERLARAAELPESAIDAARTGSKGSLVNDAEGVILELTEELLNQHGLSAASREKALALLTANQLADLVFTVGFYQLVCNFLTTFGVPVEP